MGIINLVFSSEDLRRIDLAADGKGISVQRYIIDAAIERMQRDLHFIKKHGNDEYKIKLETLVNGGA